MALPYGPVLRGMTPSWIYTRIRSVLQTKFKNPEGALVFAADPRSIGFEKIDPRVIARESRPFASITLEPGAVIRNSPRGGISETIYNTGTIDHTGTGCEASLSGAHQGNNQFRLLITASGTVGTDGEYTLYTTPWTGSAWGTEVEVSEGAIPVTGLVACGNGQTITLTIGENVVEGDTYTWETEAYGVANALGREVQHTARVHIFTVFPDEAALADGYLDQLYLLFTERWFSVPVFTGYSVLVEEEVVRLSHIRHFEEREDGDLAEIGLEIRLEIVYRGAEAGKQPVVFTAQVSPLVTAQINEISIPE